jgi:hypothetical protein
MVSEHLNIFQNYKDQFFIIKPILWLNDKHSLVLSPALYLITQTSSTMQKRQQVNINNATFLK